MINPSNQKEQDDIFMTQPFNPISINPQAVVRLTALWACSEAFLGGMLYALRVPMAGILLATFASCCITMIALSTQSKGAILKATVIVIAVKFALSPHSPVMAYLAVGIQGLAGELFFMRRKHLIVASFAISIFSLVYSALQHLLVLLVLFGKEFYDALNLFLHKITMTFLPNAHNIAGYLVFIYLATYFVAGVLAGLLNVKIVKKFNARQYDNYILEAQKSIYIKTPIRSTKKKWLRFKNVLILLSLFCIIMLFTTYVPSMENLLSKNKLIFILIRSLLIGLVWLLVLSPLIQYILRKYLQKKKVEESNYFQSVMQLLPTMKSIISKSWEDSKNDNKWVQLQQFIFSCFILGIYYE